MVELYLEHIRNGTMTVEQVPELWREAVKSALEKAEEP